MKWILISIGFLVWYVIGILYCIIQDVKDVKEPYLPSHIKPSSWLVWGLLGPIWFLIHLKDFK